MRSLDGKIAIVTGAGRGIGRAISIELAGQGAIVFGGARTLESLQETASFISGSGRGEFVPLQLDVSDEADVKRCFEVAGQRGPVQILVNNAGVGSPAPLLDISLADWEGQMAINARGMFLMTREAARVMCPRGSGDVINLSSLAGKRPVPGFSAYSASKFAAVGFTEAVARELRKSGVRVTSLCPGAVATDLRKAAAPNEDAAAITQPEQIAGLVSFLLTQGFGARDLIVDVF